MHVHHTCHNSCSNPLLPLTVSFHQETSQCKKKKKPNYNQLNAGVRGNLDTNWSSESFKLQYFVREQMIYDETDFERWDFSLTLQQSSRKEKSPQMITLNPIFSLDLQKTSLFVKRGARLLPAASAPFSAANCCNLCKLLRSKVRKSFWWLLPLFKKQKKTNLASSLIAVYSVLARWSAAQKERRWSTCRHDWSAVL